MKVYESADTVMYRTRVEPSIRKLKAAIKAHNRAVIKLEAFINDLR